MAPEVLFTVCYRTAKPTATIAKLYTFQPAVLPGFCRRRVKDADYPGIIKDPEHVVRGTFVTGLTDGNMYHLDFFEGGQYERRRVEVNLLDKVGDDKGAGNEEGKGAIAEVYVFKDKYKNDLEESEWDFDEFRREKMQKWTIVDHAFEGKLSEKSPNDRDDEC